MVYDSVDSDIPVFSVPDAELSLVLEWYGLRGFILLSSLSESITPEHMLLPSLVLYEKLSDLEK